ncbi:MAG: hypothetical protein N3D83_02625 [Pyrobaculum aerophilum]|nr:hypothetical protein [Pyrobaculum aerophilum]MCX8135925.1 hypothetical protein [Pyrobaculum aerophilum]
MWTAVRCISQKTNDAAYIRLFAEAEQLRQNFYEGCLEEYE